MTPYRTEVLIDGAWRPTTSVRLADSEAHALALELAAIGRATAEGIRVVALGPAGGGDPPQRAVAHPDLHRTESAE